MIEDTGPIYESLVGFDLIALIELIPVFMITNQKLSVILMKKFSNSIFDDGL